MDTAWYNPGNASCVPGRAHWNPSLTDDITAGLSLVSVGLQPDIETNPVTNSELPQMDTEYLA